MSPAERPRTLNYVDFISEETLGRLLPTRLCLPFCVVNVFLALLYSLVFGFRFYLLCCHCYYYCNVYRVQSRENSELAAVQSVGSRYLNTFTNSRLGALSTTPSTLCSNADVVCCIE